MFTFYEFVVIISGEVVYKVTKIWGESEVDSVVGLKGENQVETVTRKKNFKTGCSAINKSSIFNIEILPNLKVHIMKTNGKIKILIISAMLFVVGCGKSGDTTPTTPTPPPNPCWQAFDPLGEDVNGLQICNRTQAEAEATWPQYWFYNAGETKYCWRAQPAGGPVFYAGNIPQSMADKMWALYGYTYTKVDCSSFCKWQIIEKRKSKSTGLYTPNRLFIETLFADTCSKLFEGRIVIHQETTDSLITREFFKKL